MICQIIICFILVQTISAQYIGYNGLITDYGAPCAGSLASPVAALGAPLSPLAAPCGAPLAPLPYGALSPAEIAGFSPAASYGGSFAVTSASPIIPTGITVASENAYDGALTVVGRLPFLSAVALEGSLPTAGLGAISYGCGNGNVAILNEEPLGYGPVGYGGPFGYGGPVGYNGYPGLNYGLY